jgi:iron complex transport system permease protein
VRRRYRKWLFTSCALLGLLSLVCVLSLFVGSTGLSFQEMLLLLSGQSEIGPAYSLFFDIRLPRIILGIAVGGGLSLAGVILQGIFRNPLVEPFTLGISGGAALGVCLISILGLSRLYSLPLAGFAGAFSVIFFLNFLTTRKGFMSIQGLLLAGVMINFISSSLVTLIMSILRVEQLHGVLFWIIGTLGESDWLLVNIAIWTSVSGLLLSYFFCFDLNALLLGEEEAHHLGIGIARTKQLLFALASLLTGVCVSLTGAIGFVGLVVPHFMRMVVGNDHRILLISSFLAGAMFLVLCDTIAKTIAFPIELPVGVVTGILGGLVFIYTLTKKRIPLGRQ